MNENIETAFARLKGTRQSAQKVRLVANMVRGMKIEPAEHFLQLSTKKASKTIYGLLRSAKYNADQKDLDLENLKIKTITVDEGPTWKRFIPRAQGRATRILKRTSHISITLGY